MDKYKLTLEELKYVQKEVATYTKHIVPAYLFAVFLGFLGLHRAYFGKKKTAVLKTLITFFLCLTLGLIANKMVGINAGIEITRTILTGNAVLAISFLGFLSVGVLWQLLDLLLIPSWKRDWDEKLSIKAAKDVIQGRNVATQLLRTQLSDELVEGAKNEAIHELNKMLLDIQSGELKTLEKPSIPKLPNEEILNDNPTEELKESEEIETPKELKESEELDNSEEIEAPEETGTPKNKQAELTSEPGLQDNPGQPETLLAESTEENLADKKEGLDTEDKTSENDVKSDIVISE